MQQRLYITAIPLLAMLLGLAMMPPEPPVETFESQGFQLYPWQLGGHVPWQVSSQGAYKGIFSARSGQIGNSQSSFISLSLDVVSSGKIMFARRVSSEQGFDFLKFYIDGVEMSRWSGSISWGEVSFPVSVGWHTFTWSYEKDGAGTSGIDAALIDEIHVPLHQVAVLTTGEANTANTPAMLISPNPVVGHARVVVDLSDSQIISLELCNLEGRVLRELIHQELYAAGKHELITSVSDLSPGVYLMRLLTPTGETTRKVVKQY